MYPFFLTYLYIFSPILVLLIFFGFIFGLYAISEGVKRIVYFFLTSFIATLVINFFYLIIFSPSTFIDFQHIAQRLAQPYYAIQLVLSLLTCLGGMYLATFIRHTIKKQIQTSMQSVSVQNQSQETVSVKKNPAKIIIIVLFTGVLLIAGVVFAYQRITYAQKLSADQKISQEKYKNAMAKINEDAKKQEENDKKYFTEKIITIFAIGGNVLGPSKGGYPESASVEYFIPKTNTWTKGPSLQTARAYASSVGATDAIYVFGGTALSSSDVPMNSVEVLDVKTGLWSYKKPMPVGRSLASAIYLNGKIYLIGGQGKSFQKLNTMDIYDPKTNEWIQGVPMPGTIATDSPMCGAVGQKIYCLKVTDKAYTLVFDTISNSWQEISTENRSKQFIGTATTVRNNIIGVVSMSPESTYLTTYNVLTDSYSKEFTGAYMENEKTLVAFPKVIDSFGVAAVEDYLLVIGGDTSSGPKQEVYVLNTSYPKKWWKLGSLTTAREHLAVATVPILYGSQQTGYGSIKGTVFSDTNKNLQFDTGESGIGNVKVILVGTKTYYNGGDRSKPVESFGNDIATISTDTQGNYVFENVSPGRYQVQVENPQYTGERWVITKILGGGKISQTAELGSGQTVENYNYILQ